MKLFLKYKYKCEYLWVFIVTFTFFDLLKADRDESVKNQSSDSQTNFRDPVQLYRGLLKHKRDDQLQAVRKMQKIEDYEKQFKLVNLILQKLFKVIGENRLTLIEAGFVPGDAFPTDESLKDAFSMIAENTAFLGDIVLRLPDITHKVISKNREWSLAIRWCVGFMNESTVYEARETELLNLMAQELDIIAKSANYVNPFKEDARLDKLAEQLLREEELKKKTKEKKKKKKERGPRLSGGRNEL